MIIHLAICSIASQLEAPDLAFEELLDLLVATAIESRTIAVPIKLGSRSVAVEVGRSARVRRRRRFR
jgi:hypothetical protein